MRTLYRENCIVTSMSAANLHINTLSVLVHTAMQSVLLNNRLYVRICFIRYHLKSKRACGTPARAQFASPRAPVRAFFMTCPENCPSRHSWPIPTRQLARFTSDTPTLPLTPRYACCGSQASKSHLGKLHVQTFQRVGGCEPGYCKQRAGGGLYKGCGGRRRCWTRRGEARCGGRGRWMCRWAP
jgi:hypothetical protein